MEDMQQEFGTENPTNMFLRERRFFKHRAGWHEPATIRNSGPEGKITGSNIMVSDNLELQPCTVTSTHISLYPLATQRYVRQ